MFPWHWIYAYSFQSYVTLKLLVQIREVKTSNFEVLYVKVEFFYETSQSINFKFQMSRSNYAFNNRSTIFSTFVIYCIE